MNGFIKIHRKMQEWEWYQDSETVHLFLHLLLKANFTETKWKGETLKRGQLPVGIAALSEQTGISFKKVRHRLNLLESSGEIVKKRANKYTLITICKYDEYQVEDNCAGQSKGNQRAIKGQHCKKDKKEKKKEYIVENESRQQIPYTEIVSYLNSSVGSDFRSTTKVTRGFIRARWNEGFRLDDFKAVIDSKAEEWLGDEKMAEYLRPQTLFGTKFEAYRQAAGDRPNKPRMEWK